MGIIVRVVFSCRDLVVVIDILVVRLFVVMFIGSMFIINFYDNFFKLSVESLDKSLGFRNRVDNFGKF